MQCYQICGARPLGGETFVSGAKNAVLPILAACTLCRGPCVLHNCPEIADVDTTLAMLRSLGAETARSGSTLVVDASRLSGCTLPSALAAKLRSSVLFAGALLAAAGRAKIPLPGGCPLGKRPIDLHLSAFQKMGAAYSVNDGYYEITWESPHASVIEFPTVSVGATENAVLAALGYPGETTIKNAATEPEITDFLNFLRSAGAQIRGAGTREIQVVGGRPLGSTTYSVLPDRIETATFLFAACGCGGEVFLRRTDIRALQSVVELLRQMGCEIAEEQNAVRLRRTQALRALPDIKTAIYPGFPTDCQAPLTAALLRAEGESRIEETIFEDRFHHVPELQKIGAALRVDGNVVKIEGRRSLRGAELTAHDLRGGAALVLAAMQAEGESRIFGLQHIDRGYEHFENKLRALGAEILRTSVG